MNLTKTNSFKVILGVAFITIGFMGNSQASSSLRFGKTDPKANCKLCVTHSQDCGKSEPYSTTKPNKTYENFYSFCFANCNTKRNPLSAHCVQAHEELCLKHSLAIKYQMRQKVLNDQKLPTEEEQKVYETNFENMGCNSSELKKIFSNAKIAEGKRDHKKIQDTSPPVTAPAQEPVEEEIDFKEQDLIDAGVLMQKYSKENHEATYEAKKAHLQENMKALKPKQVVAILEELGIDAPTK